MSWLQYLLSGHRARTRALLIFIVAAAFFVFGGVSSAQTSHYFYAYNTPTDELQSRSSGIRPEISGGRVEVEPFSADGFGTAVYIETYISYPGYQFVGSGEGGQWANMSHKRATSATQYCFWNLPWASGNNGSLKLTCNTTH